jgi:hypothetical protein
MIHGFQPSSVAKAVCCAVLAIAISCNSPEQIEKRLITKLIDQSCFGCKFSAIDKRYPGRDGAIYFVRCKADEESALLICIVQAEAREPRAWIFWGFEFEDSLEENSYLSQLSHDSLRNVFERPTDFLDSEGWQNLSGDFDTLYGVTLSSKLRRPDTLDVGN